MGAVDSYFKLKIIEEIIGVAIFASFVVYLLVLAAKEWWGKHRRKK